MIRAARPNSRPTFTRMASGHYTTTCSFCGNIIVLDPEVRAPRFVYCHADCAREGRRVLQEHDEATQLTIVAKATAQASDTAYRARGLDNVIAVARRANLANGKPVG